MVHKLVKCQTITKDYNFVKNMTFKIQNYMHIFKSCMAEHSAKFQINSIKKIAAIARVRFESSRAITPPK